MAETLGSLVDKLSIKCIREFYLKKALHSKKSAFPLKQLRQKLDVLTKQKTLQIKEIDEFIITASTRTGSLREEKLKLYNKPKDIGQIGIVTTVAKAIDGLSKKNFELWQLEDEARRDDIPLSSIGGIKRKIDRANQQRNDFIDKIDELFEKETLKKKRA
jgi:hypothetical protein